MSKTLVIHHSSDYDGLFCREIAKKHFGDNATYLGWDYGDHVPFVPHHVDLVMLDISIEQLMTHPKLVWIDHHGSAMRKYADNISGYRIDGVAACRLAWQYFFGQTSHTLESFRARMVDEPWAVRLAGEHDIHDLRDDDADIFQFGLDACTPIPWDELLQMKGDGNDFDKSVYQILNWGRIARTCFEKRNADLFRLGRSFDLQWEGLHFLCLNTPRCNSGTFKSAITPEHDALLGFFWNGRNWTVSLYGMPGKPDIDLSKIAVKHGGGGHKQACGFTSKSPFWLAPASFAERVVLEKQELDDRRGKLTTFIGGECFRNLPEMERSRLNRQLEAMTLYSNILDERIASFPK